MNKMYNAVMGAVVGDALGVPVEFKKRDTFCVVGMMGYGTYNQPPGTWSDDSSMILATLESMKRLGKVDPADIMNNFYKWFTNGDFTPYGEVFDIGAATRRAIYNHSRGIAPEMCGGRESSDNGNGALMRIIPVAVMKQDTFSVARLTHAHYISNAACHIYEHIVFKLVNGKGKEDVYYSINKDYSVLAGAPVYYDFLELSRLNDLTREEIRSTGYVVDTLIAALWCFLKTENYRDCVLKAVNLGGDTDTIASVAGGLAGLLYGCGGENGIPEEWIEQIPKKDYIKTLCEGISF